MLYNLPSDIILLIRTYLDDDTFLLLSSLPLTNLTLQVPLHSFSDYTFFYKIIKFNKTLIYLSLYGYAISHQELQILNTCNLLKELKISNLEVVNTNQDSFEFYLHLAGFKYLEKLFIGPSSLSGSGIKALQKLKYLKQINLSFNPVSDMVFAGLLSSKDSVEKIVLDRAELKGQLFFILGQFSTLYHLNIGDNHLCFTAFHLLKHIKTLRTLNIENTGMKLEEMAIVSTIQNIQHLKLSGNKIEDEGFSLLRQLRSLKELIVSRCGITYRCVSQFDFSTFSHLSYLDLSGNLVCNFGIFEMIFFPENLILLDLSCTELIEIGDKTVEQLFDRCKKLAALNLRENRITNIRLVDKLLTSGLFFPGSSLKALNISQNEKLCFEIYLSESLESLLIYKSPFSLSCIEFWGCNAAKSVEVARAISKWRAATFKITWYDFVNKLNFELLS